MKTKLLLFVFLIPFFSVFLTENLVFASEETISFLPKIVVDSSSDAVAIIPSETEISASENFSVDDISFEKKSDESFSFGIENLHLQFSKPVEMRFPVFGKKDGEKFFVMVQHEGEKIPGKKGISTNPNAICENGISNDENNEVEVKNGEALFYTCGASTFFLSLTNGSAVITKPAYGSTMMTGNIVFRGTGSDETLVTLRNENSLEIGSAMVQNGFWEIVPTENFSEGSHMVCIDGSGCSIFSVIPPLSPARVEGNRLWLRAENASSVLVNGENVSEWINFGNDGDVFSASEGQQAVFSENSINFHPALAFDGIDDFFSGNGDYGISGNTGFTSFVVSVPQNISSSMAWWGSSNPSSSSPVFFQNNQAKAVIGTIGESQKTGFLDISPEIPLLSAVSKTADHVFQLFQNGNLDGAASSLENFSGFSNGNLHVGRHTGKNFSGKIAEILMFDTAISEENRKKIESYFAVKYGIPIVHDIVSTNGVVWWNVLENPNFSHDIFGIGTDEESDLAQKISTSASTESILTIATTNNFSEKNSAASRTALPNESAFLVGHNEGTATWSEENTPSSFKILNRIWKGVGFSENSLFFQFHVENPNFNVPELLYGSAYYVVIDENGDGSFEDEEPVELSSSVANFWTGNFSVSGKMFTLATEILDIIPPEKPILLQVNADESVPYVLPSSLPTLSGTGEKKATVHVKKSDGTEICSGLVGTDKKWSCSFSSPLLEGENAFVLTQTDRSGNVSVEENFSITLDTIAPENPTLITVDEDVTAPYLVKRLATVFVGNGEVGATIEVKKSDGTFVCSGLVASNAEWFCTASGLTEGINDLVFLQKDESGNTSDETPFYVVVDTHSPSPPLVSGVSMVNNFPKISGTGELGGTIVVKDQNNNPICSAAVQNDGTWECIGSTVVMGDYSYTIIQTDTAGNFSSGASLVKDTTPPVRPSLSTGIQNNEAFFSFKTNTKIPTIEGFGEENSTIVLKKVSDETVVCSTIIPSSGKWACTPSNPLDEGLNHLFMLQTDSANNFSPTTFVDILVDTTPPTMPALLQVGNSTVAPWKGNGNAKFSGTGESTAFLTIKKENGSVVCSGIVGNDGRWSCSAVGLLDGNENFSITQTDEVGNISPDFSFSLEIDATIPVMPEILSVDTDTEIPFISMHAAPVFAGIGTVGETVEMRNANDTVLCSAVVSENASWSCLSTIAFANGTFSLNAVQKDNVENISEKIFFDMSVTIPSFGSGGGGGGGYTSPLPSSKPIPTPIPEPEREVEIRDEEIEKILDDTPLFSKFQGRGGWSFMVIYEMLLRHNKLKAAPSENCISEKFSFPEIPKKIIFSDVFPHEEGASAAIFLAEKAIVEGSQKTGKLQLRKKLSRAEFAKIITKARQDTILTGEKCKKISSFPDVPKTEWFSPFVQNMVEKGILKGYSNGKFFPEKEVKLAEVYKILALSFDYISEEEAEKMARTHHWKWYIPYRLALQKADVIPQNIKTLKPEKELKRSEIFMFLEKVLKDQEKED